MNETVQAAFESAKNAFSEHIGGLASVTWDQLPRHIKDYLVAHPKLAAFQIVFIIVAAIPGLAVGPALGAVGFGYLGPVAGCAAPAYQALHGATPLFSCLQGAAMGGSAPALLLGAVSYGAVAAAGVMGMFKWRNGTAPNA